MSRSANCAGCGCTEDRACEGGCAWELEDVCSACVSKIIYADAEKVAIVDGRWDKATRTMLVYSVLCSLYKRPLEYRQHGI